MARIDIRDSRNCVVGYAEDNGREIKYWTQGPKISQLGPKGDIGYSEVMSAEGAK